MPPSMPQRGCGSALPAPTRRGHRARPWPPTVQVRAQLVPKPSDPVWSGYTCFAAIARCVPDDIKHVGYKVFLGERKFFVCVDVGGGRLQWCVLPRKARPTTSHGP